LHFLRLTVNAANRIRIKIRKLREISYCGAKQCRHLYTVMHSLKVTRCATTHQNHTISSNATTRTNKVHCKL